MKDLFPEVTIDEPVKIGHRYLLKSSGSMLLAEVKAMAIERGMILLRWQSGDEIWSAREQVEKRINKDLGYCCVKLITRDGQPCLRCLGMTEAEMPDFLNLPWERDPVSAQNVLLQRISQTLDHGSEAVVHLLKTLGSKKSRIKFEAYA